MNIALIGYGYWGPNVAKNIYSNPKLSLKAICDLKKERLEKARNLYAEHVTYFTNYHELLTNPEIDAVAIAVETSAHYQVVKNSLIAGKHVYVEKPFVSSVKHGEELALLAEKMNLVIHVDHIMIYHPCIKKIKELVESNELGELLYIDAMRMNLGQIKKDVSAMEDLAVHDLSIIDYLTNGEEPFYLRAVGEKKYNSRESLTFLILRYKNFIAHIQSSWISPLKERKLIVAGTRKMIVFDDIRPTTEKLIIYDKGIEELMGADVEYSDYVVRTRNGDINIPFIKDEDALYNSLEHFYNCITLKKSSDSGPKQALRVLKILDDAKVKMNT